MSATLIQRAVERGLVSFSEPRPRRVIVKHPDLQGLPPLTYKRLWTRWQRDQLRKQGLTVLGKPRRRPWVRRPEWAGLSNAQKCRLYRDIWRAQ